MLKLPGYIIHLPQVCELGPNDYYYFFVPLPSPDDPTLTTKKIGSLRRLLLPIPSPSPAPTYHPETPPFNLTHPPDPIDDPPQYLKRVRQIKTSSLAIK
jgi:hypothetical protein